MEWLTDFWYAVEDARFWVGDSLCEVASPILADNIGRYCSRFFNGFVVTAQLTIIAFVLGSLLAIPLSWIRHHGRGAGHWAVSAFLYVFRGTPLLVQLWILYFGIGGLGKDVLGVWWGLFRDPYWVGLLGLTLNTCAYSTEIIRGGLANVGSGQIEAARAIGMSRWASARRIEFPQALAIAWPAYTNELILLIKGSALVSTITVFDLMGVTRTVFARSYDLSIFVYASFLYIVLVAVATITMQWLERVTVRRGLV